MRKLASIQIIDDVCEARGFDRLELVRILGWEALVKKGEFQKGQKIIYIEYDSLLPKDIPEFAFMEAKKFQIKTLKLNGKIYDEDGNIIETIRYISQGLVFSLNLLKSVGLSDDDILQLEIDDDVTEQLHIVKYEPPEDNGMREKLGFKRSRNFPDFITKTDETRLQSIPRILDELYTPLTTPYYVSIKDDGSSATYYSKQKDGLENVHFGICSRNMEITEFDETNVYCKMATKYDLRNKLNDHYIGTGEELALQGEICGPGMNGSGVYKNPLGLSEVEFHVFNIYNISAKRYFDYLQIVDFLTYYSIPMVTVIEEDCTTIRTVKEWIDFSSEVRYPVSGKYAEGIVVRPMIEQYSQTERGRFSFKVISNNYLTKGK
ncbi:MAG: hypothetical protein KC589_04980 [Nanoarchaeota archaeon]|nr:hypothetical protein [Nanoarchaeota archaeon]